MSEPPRCARPLQVRVADLLTTPGLRREVEGRRNLDDLAVGHGRVPDGALDVELVLEAQAGRIICSGSVRARWELQCRRCLGPVRVPVAPPVTEVFETRPAEGETFPLDGENIDLAPMLREVVLLTLPLAPLCDESCAGPSGGSYYHGPEGDDGTATTGGRDPRWAALDNFRP